MKIKNRKSKLPIVAVLLVIVLVTGVAGFAYFSSLNKENDTPPNKGVNYEDPSSEQVKAGNDAKESTVKNNASSNSAKSPTGNSTPSLSETGLKTQITTATTQNGTVYIRNNINGIYQEGSCTLALSKDGKVVQKTAGIQPLPQSSTCKGFNIPTSELTSGKWKINLEVIIGDQKATATSEVAV